MEEKKKEPGCGALILFALCIIGVLVAVGFKIYLATNAVGAALGGIGVVILVIIFILWLLYQ